MPTQETFLELQHGDKLIRVVKTYDTSFAREAFQAIDDAGLRVLAASLELNANYDASDVPSAESADYSDFVWEELLDGAREDGQVRSFFVVTVEEHGSPVRTPFVSGDWPTAESFAKRIGDVHSNDLANVTA